MCNMCAMGAGAHIILCNYEKNQSSVVDAGFVAVSILDIQCL